MKKNSDGALEKNVKILYDLFFKSVGIKEIMKRGGKELSERIEIL